MTETQLPQIIQGGMGVGVSSWRLARVVAREGVLGVVSGTALDVVLARRLQLGDADGSVRRALAAFPVEAMAQRILETYFVDGGKAPGSPFKSTPALTVPLSPESTELIAVANFVEVWLAREGHDGVIGINYLEKIQIPTLPSLFGAMAAGVDVVLMGAGIPVAIPAVLDGISRWEPVEYRLTVTGSEVASDTSDREVGVLRFDPREFVHGAAFRIERPAFLAIVASDVVARTILRRSSSTVDGFVVESHVAGGHNAPPRGGGSRGATRPREFGQRDEPDLAAFRKLERPFWIAGAQASPRGLRDAQAAGARGIQVGTIFAYCEESGTRADLKRAVLQRHAGGQLSVRTDFDASPTGYPFKLLELPGTTADPALVSARPRVCDLGFLREIYRDGEGNLAFRCAGEPVDVFLRKGGTEEQAAGKQCLCNGLLATIGLGQTRRRRAEPPMLTAGTDFSFLDRVCAGPSRPYTASDVIAYLRG